MTIETQKIAIIGAGMTGVTCARMLVKAGATVDVFEKSRGTGGRMATRRFDANHSTSMTADHGAQYFTCNTPAFQQFLDSIEPSSSVAQWPVRNDTICFVGTPHMNSPLKAALDGANLRTSQLVEAVDRCENNWWLSVDGEQVGPYDYVVSTVPAPQAVAFSRSANLGFEEALGRVKIAPCWALMLVFENPLNTDIKSWRGKHDIVGWIGRNSSKPGRDFAGDSWTVHATPDWSEAHLEQSQDEAANHLHRAFKEIIGGVTAKPTLKTAHRWRYAQTVKPAGGTPFLSDPSRTFFFGGDWCLGARVEYAFKSGHAIANAIIGP